MTRSLITHNICKGCWKPNFINIAAAGVEAEEICPMIHSRSHFVFFGFGDCTSSFPLPAAKWLVQLSRSLSDSCLEHEYPEDISPILRTTCVLLPFFCFKSCVLGTAGGKQVGFSKAGLQCQINMLLAWLVWVGLDSVDTHCNCSRKEYCAGDRALSRAYSNFR